MPHCRPMTLNEPLRGRVRPSRSGRPSGPCCCAPLSPFDIVPSMIFVVRPAVLNAGPRYCADELRVERRRPERRRVALGVVGLVLGGDRLDRDPLPLYAWTHFTKYWACAVRFAATSCMHPPSKALPPMLAHEVPLTVPLVVFIQVGGVHGLAQKRMLPLTACAAFTYGIRYIVSRVIEKLVRLVSLRRARRRCSARARSRWRRSGCAP